MHDQPTRPISAARVKLAELFAWQSIHDSHLTPFVDALNHAEELLAALQQAQALLAKGTHLGGSVEAFQQYRDTCNAVDAAIAAATGEA